jgi:hypothetical protein
MISSLLFSLSALCFVAMLLPKRSSQAGHQLETYYVCDPESFPNSDRNVPSLAMAGGVHN